jgi:hydrogenase-4 component B
MRRIVAALIAVCSLAAAMAGATALFQHTAIRIELSVVTPFPFVLTLDQLSAFFLLLIGSAATPVAIFSASYFELHYSDQLRNWIWGFVSLFLLSMIVVVTASTIFAFLFAWELMTLVSAGLVLMEGDSPERSHNVFIYLLMMHAGAAAVAASFFLFLPFSHTQDFEGIRFSLATVPLGTRTAIFVLAFAGFGVKAGIIPLHLWLPRAHPIAPSPVSALMSGIMLKTAVYGLVRFAFDFLGGGPWWSGYVVLLIAAVTALLGILYAIAEHDLKRLLAYSSVENIGIIFLGLGTSLIFAAHHNFVGAALALTAALMHAFNHALFKSLLFLGAGAVSHATHTLDLNQLGGLQRRMPATGLAMLVGCCSIAGLPLFNGFISEWLTFRSFVAGSTVLNTKTQVILPLMVGILAMIGGLAAACFVKVFGVGFLGRPRSAGAEHAEEAPFAMRASLSLLAAACVCVGIFPGILLRPLGLVIGGLIPAAGLPADIVSFTRIIPWTAAIVLGIAGMAVLLSGGKRIARTWACGLPGLTSRMQYSSTGFSKPIRFVFARVYRPERKVERLPADQPYFPVSVSYSSVRTTSWERAIYRPFVDLFISIAYQLRRLQTGNIQVYLLYIFLALVCLLTFVRFER